MNYNFVTPCHDWNWTPLQQVVVDYCKNTHNLTSFSDVRSPNPMSEYLIDVPLCNNYTMVITPKFVGLGLEDGTYSAEGFTIIHYEDPKLFDMIDEHIATANRSCSISQ